MGTYHQTLLDPPRDRQHEKTYVSTYTAIDAISNLKVGSDAYENRLEAMEPKGD